MDSKQFIESISKFYWSPHPPETYTFVHNGKVSGIGKIAHNNYAAFNIAWALTNPSKNPATHVEAIKVFSYVGSRMAMEVEGAPLSDWATLLTHNKFIQLYIRNRHKFLGQEIDITLNKLVFASVAYKL